MTIAAGILHSDGILLCSDTLMEGGAVKFQAPKIGMFECRGGKLAFAIAGHAAFATAAVQALSERVKDLDPELVVSELQAEHERQYRRMVFEHPSFHNDTSLAYRLLIAFWSHPSRLAFLFTTTEHVLHACYGPECIGIGFELANVLSRPFFEDTLSEHDALVLAAYVLAQVKSNVPGCGGMSMFVSIRHDGTMAPVMSVLMDQIESVAARYDKAAHSLLFAMGDDSDDRLELELKEFGERSRELSLAWRNVRSANQEAPQYLRVTTAGLSPEPPSRESRATSGES